MAETNFGSIVQAERGVGLMTKRKIEVDSLQKMLAWKRRDARRQLERDTVKKRLIKALAELAAYERGEVSDFRSVRWVLGFLGRFSKKNIARTRTSGVSRFSSALHRLRMKNGIMGNLKIGAERCEGILEEIIEHGENQKINKKLIIKGMNVVGALHRAF